MLAHDDPGRRRRTAPAFARYARLVTATLDALPDPELAGEALAALAATPREPGDATPIDPAVAEATTLAAAALLVGGGLRIGRRRSGSVHAAAGAGMRVGGSASPGGAAPRLDRRG